MSFNKNKAIKERRAKLEKTRNVVYWNWKSTGEKAETGMGDEEGVIEYIVLINNQDTRTLQRAKDGIAGYLENMHTNERLLEGTCKWEDKITYHYSLLKLTSTKSPIELTNSPGKIYAGRVIRDKKLTDHANDESLILYVKGKIGDLIGVELP